jgi:Ca2+-binding RTX toxin-like protein
MQPSDAATQTVSRITSIPASKEHTMFIPPSGGPTNTVNTGCGDDNVHISKADGLAGLLGLYEVNINGQKQFMTKQQLENTQFNLGSGNDRLVVDSNVTADISANGGTGNDLMVGGSGDDDLHGGAGNDVIAGRGGNDHVDGGRGNDRLYGGNGRDHIDGGAGHDHIHAGNGNDVVHAGSGNDYVDGGNGNDALYGQNGHDHIDGGNGHDYLKGGNGFDTLHGGRGIDWKNWS